MNVRASIAVNNMRIQTRSTLQVFGSHIKLKFPDAKGLEVVFSYEELEQLQIDILKAQNREAFEVPPEGKTGYAPDELPPTRDPADYE